MKKLFLKKFYFSIECPVCFCPVFDLCRVVDFKHLGVKLGDYISQTNTSFSI